MSLNWFIGEFKGCIDVLILGKWQQTTNECSEIFFSIQNTTKQLDCLQDFGNSIDILDQKVKSRLHFQLVNEIQRLSHLLNVQMEKYLSIYNDLSGKFKGFQAKFKNDIIEEKSLAGFSKKMLLECLFEVGTACRNEINKKKHLLDDLYSFQSDLAVVSVDFLADEKIDFYKGKHIFMLIA